MNDKNGTILFKQFDLLFFSVMAVISDGMSYLLLERLNSDFYFSFSVALCLIAMIRWGVGGVVVGLAGGIPGIFFSDMNIWAGVLFYVAANAALVIPIAAYGSRSRDLIAGSTVRLLMYILISHCCLSLGKGVAILLLTGEMTGVVDFFGVTLFILIINMILCCVLRMRGGLVCDMRSYFSSDESEGEENEKRRN